MNNHKRINIFTDLEVPTYQRGVVKTHPLTKRTYREDLEGVLTGYLLPSGKYALVDGLQRVFNKKRSIENEEDLSPFMTMAVFQPADEAEAARVFLDMNRDRKVLTQFDNYRAGVAAGMPEYLMLDNIFDDLGLTPTAAGRDDRDTHYVKAIGACLKVYGADEHGVGDVLTLRAVLAVLVDAFPYQAPNQRLIQQLASFFRDPEVGDSLKDHAYIVGKLTRRYPRQRSCVDASTSYAMDEGYDEDSTNSKFFRSVLGTKRRK